MCSKSEAAVGVQRIRSGLEHPFDTGVHFFFFDELTSVGLLDTFADCGTNAGVLFKQMQRRVPHELFSILTSADGDLRKLIFLVGGEVYFHAQC
jgi:hypothetical protein